LLLVFAARAAVRGALAPVLLALAGSACAQDAVGTLGTASADRYRGLGPTYGGALLRAGGSVDSPLGLYASGAAQYQVEGAHWGRNQVLAGVSRSIDADWSWDLAGARTFFGQDADYDYTEWMVGLLHRDGGVRAWWSRHYYGQRAGSLYLEANASYALSSRWRLIGHVGRLGYLGGDPAWPPPGPRVDGLVGLAWSEDGFDVRLTVDGLLSGRAPSSHTDGGAAPGAVLSASWAY
jgi:hypothetical protein